MAGDIKMKYGDSTQCLAITLNCVANAAARQSTYVDNATNLFVDALVAGWILSNTAGTNAAGYANIYAYGTVNDTGTCTYTDGAAGADGAMTLTAPPNARLIGVVNIVANGTNYYFGPFSVAAAFGGVLPRRWGVIIENKTCAAYFNTTAATCFSVQYQGVLAQYT